LPSRLSRSHQRLSRRSRIGWRRGRRHRARRLLLRVSASSEGRWGRVDKQSGWIPVVSLQKARPL
jgi:hypothetical protein